MIVGLDHFVVLVNDLDAATQAFMRLGFQVRAGGQHPAFGSHNALVPLADGTYLELVAFKDPVLAAKSFWRDGVRRLEVAEGFGAFAMSSRDLAEDVSQLRQEGLNPGEPETGSRLRPDGQRVAWRIALFGGSPTGQLPFLIQDDTPHALRIEPPQQGTGVRTKVKDIVVAVKDPAAARDAYHALLHVEPKRVQNTTGDLEGYRIAMEWGNIILAQPLREGNAMSDQLSQRGEGLYALTLQVDGIGRDRRELKNRGVALQMDGNGFLIVPEFACGARIRLTA
jgi:hypothetical protein